MEEEPIVKKIQKIVNSSLSIEIIYGVISDLMKKGKMSKEEIIIILDNNYNEWEK